MSFRRYKDVPSQEDDVSLVYTKDKYGRLKTPSGYGFTANFANKDYLKDIELKAPNCSVKDHHGNISPCSLYLISLDFVAKNITMVESLFGFPDIVGKDLFDTVHINGGFTHRWSQTFSLFCDAYESLVLDKLSLRGQFLAVNEVDYLKCFSFLSELDLGHCRLGSNHELVHQLSNMLSLTRLCLKDNCLNDSDVMLFTLPLRVKKQGPLHLSLLDLSANPKISDKSVWYLVCFKSLTGLNLSGTCVTKDGISKLTRGTNLILNSKFEGFSEDQQTKTDGWATPVITEWITNLKTVKKHCEDTTETKVQSFYAKKTKANILPKNNSKTYAEKECSAMIIFSTDTTRDKLSQSTTEVNGLQKRERKNGMGQNNEKEHHSFKHKRKKENSITEKESFLDLDEDYMQSYLSTSVVTFDNKKRKLSLADLV